MYELDFDWCVKAAQTLVWLLGLNKFVCSDPLLFYVFFYIETACTRTCVTVVSRCVLFIYLFIISCLIMLIAVIPLCVELYHTILPLILSHSVTSSAFRFQHACERTCEYLWYISNLISPFPTVSLRLLFISTQAKVIIACRTATEHLSALKDPQSVLSTCHGFLINHPNKP